MANVLFNEKNLFSDVLVVVSSMNREETSVSVSLNANRKMQEVRNDPEATYTYILRKMTHKHYQANQFKCSGEAQGSSY